MTAIARDLIHDDTTHRGPAAASAGVAEALRHWYQRAKQRRQLSRLTLRELDDVGIDADAADAEAAKPFWRA